VSDILILAALSLLLREMEKEETEEGKVESIMEAGRTEKRSGDGKKKWRWKKKKKKR